jgi:hypothetical protein
MYLTQPTFRENFKFLLFLQKNVVPNQNGYNFSYELKKW